MDVGLFGVIIGGLIGIVGSIAAPTLQHFFAERTRKEEARLANIQAVVVAVYQLDDWLEKRRAMLAYGEKHDIGVSPLAIVESHIRVHFPEAKLSLAELSFAVARYNKWGTERMQERADRIPLTMGNWKEIVHEYTIVRANLIATVCGSETIDYNAALKSNAPEIA